MRVLFTFIFLIILNSKSFTQTFNGTLSLGTSTSICASGCNSGSPGTSPFCTSCGSYAASSCTEYELSETVSVPAGQTVTITVSNASCGSSGGFDSTDEIIFRYNNGIEIIVAGNVAQNATRCFDNPGMGPLNVVFGYRANRRDEFANWTYTLSPGTGTSCLLLPVTFKDFELQNLYYNSILSFSTASETNNDYFSIERSSDGRSFDVIGVIKGAGNSTEEKQYEFVDENPLPGINYYRIKQTDFDGQYSYSEIRSVRHTGKGNVAISPRSTDGRLDISTEMESYDVAVYSSSGQEVARFAALSGHQTVNIEALHAGVYFVKVMGGSESETVRVAKF